MKCYFHQNLDAIGVCIDCGKGLCSTCKLELVGKLYCQSCADELVTNSTKPAPVRNSIKPAPVINSTKPAPVTNSTRLSMDVSSPVSAWYYLFPLLFGFLGGLAAYYVSDNYKIDGKRAKDMFIFGIIVSLVWILLALLVKLLR